MRFQLEKFDQTCRATSDLPGVSRGQPEGVLGLGACVDGKRHQGSRNTREPGHVRRLRVESDATRAGNAEMNQERNQTQRQDLSEGPGADLRPR